MQCSPGDICPRHVQQCPWRPFTTRPAPRQHHTCRSLPSQRQHVEGRNSLFIFGLGYTTLGLANMLSQQGWHVTATLRDATAAQRLSDLKAAQGWRCVMFDPCSTPGQLSPEVLESLAQATHVVTSIPPVGLPLYDPVLSAQVKALKQVIPAGRLQWLGYLSSTGVYGDYGGDWVDEESEARSKAARGYVRHQAELAWVEAAHQAHLPLHIFRLGGIYGPGRSLMTSTAAGATTAAAASAPGGSSGSAGGGSGSSAGTAEGGSASKTRRGQQQYISRVHVYDICQALIASMQQQGADQGNTPAGDESSRSLAASLPVGARAIQQGVGEVEGVCSAGADGTVATVSRSVTDSVRVYNLVDDEPAPRAEVLAYVRRLQQQQQQVDGPLLASQQQQQQQEGNTTTHTTTDTNATSPASEAPNQQPSSEGGPDQEPVAPRGRRGAEVLEEKRVRNGRMKSDLGVTLRYGTYREGMSALLGGEVEPFTLEDLSWLGLK